MNQSHSQFKMAEIGSYETAAILPLDVNERRYLHR